MMRIRSYSAILAATALTLSLTRNAEAAPKTYTIDATHTDVIWAASHFGFSDSHGKFSDVSGEIVLDKDAPENSTVNVIINTASVTTGIEKFDTHLRSEDFFGSAEFPEATFVSKKVTLTGDKTADIEGKLTIKGKTKNVTLKATLNKIGVNLFNMKETVGFNASTTIRRSDYGISYALPGIPDMVDITISAEALLKKQKDASSSSFQVAALIDKDEKAAMNNAAEKTADNTASAINNAKDAAAQSAANTEENTQEISDNAIVVASEAAAAAEENTQEISNDAIVVATNANDVAAKSTEKAINSAEDTAADAAQSAKNTAMDVADATSDASEAIYNKAEDVKETATDVADTAGETVSDAIPADIKESATDMADALMDKASDIADNITEATKSAYDSAVKKWESWTADDTADVAADAIEHTGDIIENAGDAIEDAADEATR